MFVVLITRGEVGEGVGTGEWTLGWWEKGVGGLGVELGQGDVDRSGLPRR